MGMSCYQQVKPVLLVQLLVPLGLMPAVEVRGNDLPVCRGPGQLLFDPLLLILPDAPHPAEAVLEIGRPSRGITACIRRVVLLAANVVLGIRVHWLHVHGVAVDHQEFCAEVLVWILHTLHPVKARHSPAIAGPGISDLLVPCLVELKAAPVVIPQHTQPRNPVQAGAIVDALKDFRELLLRDRADLVHGSPTLGVDTSPVEVVAHIHHKVRTALGGPLLHLLGHERLCLPIHLAKVTALLANAACEALHHHLRLARPSPPGHGVGPGSMTAAVLDHGRIATS
mmetsp:Transcript_15491/g.36668  ORF Transcript_15491/g.36668 Transcript_15491/m.36668 type:complete len:283 (-) Transcript_15491:617-1465(-)